MGHLIERQAIEEDFASKTSTVAQFNAGEEVTVAKDGVSIPSKYKYIKAASALTAFQPYVLVNDADGITTAAPATSTVGKLIGIPQVAIASGSYGWVAIGGLCQAKVGAAAKGDALEVLNAGTNLVVDGTTGATTETANTVAVACETTTTAATAVTALIDKRVAIAAS